MTWLLGESFDQYATIADAASGFWDASALWSLQASPNGRFAGSQCLQNGSSGNGTALSKSSGSNDQGHHIVVAFQQTTAISGTSTGLWLQFLDGTTNQCCIVFRSDGAILLTSGGPTGTVLATATGLISQNAWVALEFEVTIDPTAGAFRIRKNGNTSNDFQATGLNTRGGTANNYANKLAIGQTSVSGTVAQRLDDLLWFNTTGSAPNTWVGDVRSYPLAPLALAQAQFAQASAAATGSIGSAATFSNLPVNTILYFSFVANASGTLTSLSGFAGSGTFSGNSKAAIYDASGAGGAPGTLLATSSDLTSLASAATPTWTFASPATVANGSTYYLATLADTAVPTRSGSGTLAGYTQTVSYASGFPVSGSGATASTPAAFYFTWTIARNNAGAVQEAQEDGDTSYVYSSTVGQADFYSLGALPSTPQAIVGTQLKAFAKKSDTGTRSLQMQLKSGATTTQSASVALGTSYGWVNRVDTTDPNTGAAWTGAGVNAAQIGPLVSA